MFCQETISCYKSNILHPVFPKISRMIRSQACTYHVHKYWVIVIGQPAQHRLSVAVLLWSLPNRLNISTTDLVRKAFRLKYASFHWMMSPWQHGKFWGYNIKKIRPAPGSLFSIYILWIAAICTCSCLNHRNLTVYVYVLNYNYI